MAKIKKPFLSFKLKDSDDIVERIPVMGLFINKDTVIEINIDDFMNFVSIENPTKARKIVTLDDGSQRELVFRINMKDHSLHYFAGRKNERLKASNDAEFNGRFSAEEVLLAATKFDEEARAWLINILPKNLKFKE